MRKQVSVNSQANIARSGSLNLTYCFSRHTLNKVNFLFINILLWGMLASSGHPTVAQIVPDATLGIESSVVTPLDDVGLPIDLIEGGATRSGNLFHSFLEFNIDAERGAYFYSPADIQNILARVTGANPSRILGLLGT
jgi:large exoprotein involved in heme utilization and adhesion